MHIKTQGMIQMACIQKTGVSKRSDHMKTIPEVSKNPDNMEMSLEIFERSDKVRMTPEVIERPDIMKMITRSQTDLTVIPVVFKKQGRTLMIPEDFKSQGYKRILKVFQRGDHMMMILGKRNNITKNIQELPEKKLQEELKRQDIMMTITEALEIWILKEAVHLSILRAEALQVLREVFKVN